MLKVTAITLLLALAFCAKPAPAPAPTLVTSHRPAATPSAPPPSSDSPACPAGDALKTRVMQLFALQRDDLVGEPGCAAGHFPAPGWVVELWLKQHTKDGDVYQDRLALIAPDGGLISKVDNEMPPGAMDSSRFGGLQAADFDHDGIDELVSVFAVDRAGYQSHNLIVQRLRAGHWETVLSRSFQYDNTASEGDMIISCDAEWQIAPPAADGTRAIIFKPKGNPRSLGDCIGAVETWVPGKDGKFTRK